jgi:hypothetical protein
VWCFSDRHLSILDPAMAMLRLDGVLGVAGSVVFHKTQARTLLRSECLR